MTSATASCLCGDVRLDCQLPSKWVAHCHCSLCQRSNAAAFVTWVGFEDERCRIDDAQQRLRWFESSPGAERGFCSRCGSSLLFRSQRWPGELHITRASFTGPVDREPQVHVYFDSHADYVQLGDALPRKGDPKAG